MSKLRQMTSGISLSAGSKEGGATNPPTRQEADLSHLTPEEQTILQRVFEKQERFEKEEAIRASKGRESEGRAKGRPGRASSACRICLKSLMPGEPYSHCAECKGNVCEDCGSYTSQDTTAEADAGFMCSICRRKLARANRAAEEPLDSAEEEQTPTSPPDAASPEANPISAPRVTWAAGVGAAVVPIIAVVSAEHVVGANQNKPEGNSTSKSARKSADNWARLSNSVQKERRPSDAWVKLTAAAKERRSSEVSNRLVAVQDKNRRHSERYDRAPLLEKERAVGFADFKDKGQKPQIEIQKAQNQGQKAQNQGHKAQNQGQKAQNQGQKSQNQVQNTQEAAERLKTPVADKERRLSDTYRYPVSTEDSMLTIPHQPERRASDTCVRLSAPSDQDGRSPDRLGAPPDKERSVSDTCVRQADKDRRGSEAWDRLIAPQSQPRDRRASEALTGVTWGDKLSAPQAQNRRVSEQWDKQLATPHSQERRVSEIRDKLPTVQLPDRRPSEQRNGLITPQSQERRGSEQWGDKLVTPQSHDRKTSEQWDRLPMPQSQDRRASDAGVRQSVSSDFNRRPSDVYDQLTAPPLPNRRASDISIRSSSAINQDVRSSDMWDNRLSAPQDKERRASETWNRVPPTQEQRVSDSWDRQPVVNEQQRYTSDTWQQQSVDDSRQTESWDRLAPAASDRERRASESWQRVPPSVDNDRRPSDAWNRPVAPGSERLLATDWDKPLTAKDRRASDTWDRFRALEEMQRRSAANSLDQERPTEMWETPVVEVSAAEDKPKRRPSDPWAERRTSDPWDSQRRDSWDASRRSSDAWEFDRRMSDQWDSDRQDSELWEGLPVPEIVRRLSDTGPTREKIDIPEQPRRLSDTGPPGHRIQIAGPDRRLSVFAPPWEKGPRLQRRVSEVATTWDRSKLFRGRRMSEFAGPCGGGMLERDNSLSGFRALLRQAQSDSLQDILSPGSQTSRGGRGSSASESSGPEGEGPCDDEESWRRRRSRVKRRTRSQRRSCDESPERPESMDQGSGPTRSTDGSTGGMSRHSAWESAAMVRRRSSGSSELSDAGPEPTVPPIPSRRDSQGRINGFRPMKLHHSIRQRSLRKQPPAIFVDDGDEYEAEQSAATLESSPSPDRPVRTQLLRRLSRGDTRQMLSDSEAMQDERTPEILDLLKPRRSWPEAVPSGMELPAPETELHHGRSLVDMLRGQAPPPGGYVIPRQPRSGLPHELSVDEGGNPRAEHDGIRIVIDDVDSFGTRTKKFSTVRKVTLKRDMDDGHRTRALGMRVVGGKVDGQGQLFAHVVWTVPEGQAEQMGIIKGDRVLAWNGESLVGRTFEEASAIMDRMTETVEMTIEHFSEGSHFESVPPQETHRRPKPRSSDMQGLSDSNIPSSDFPQQAMPRRRLPKTPPEIAQGSVMGQVQIQLWYARDKSDLVVTILGACSLNPRNGTPGCVPPNAYVKIRLLPLGEKSSFKTSIAEASFTPIWNASFIFANTSAEDISESQLEVTIWDYYPDRDNEFLGETIISLRRADLEDKPTWYKLHEHRVRRSNPTLVPYTPAPPSLDPDPPQAPPPSHSQPPPSAAARRIAMRRAGFQHSRSLSDEKDELEDLETGSMVKSSSVDWSMLHPDYGWDPNKRRRSSSSSDREHSAPETYRTPASVARGMQDVPPQTSYSAGMTSSPSGTILQKTGSQDEQDGTDGNGGRPRNKVFKMCRQDTPNGGAAGGSDHRRKFSQKVRKFSRSLSLKSDKRPVLGGSSGDGADPNIAASEGQEFIPDYLVSPPGIPTSKWAAASSLENPSDEGSDSGPGREEQYSAEDEPPPLPLGPGQVAPRGLQYSSRTEEEMTRGEVQLAIIMSKGQLEVEVISARGLPLNASAQPPDTYVKTYLKEGERRIQKKKTRVVRHSTEPVYRQTLRYSGCDVLGRTILVMIWERQKGFHNQGVGLAQIQINNLDLSKVTTGWYNLYPMTKLPSDSDST